jgi:hypothetical protein
VVKSSPVLYLYFGGKGARWSDKIRKECKHGVAAKVFASKFSGIRLSRWRFETIFSIQPYRQIKQDGSRIAKEEEPLVHLQGDSKGKVEEKVVTQPHHRSQLVGLSHCASVLSLRARSNMNQGPKGDAQPELPPSRTRFQVEPPHRWCGEDIKDIGRGLEWPCSRAHARQPQHQHKTAYDHQHLGSQD